MLLTTASIVRLTVTNAETSFHITELRECRSAVIDDRPTESADMSTEQHTAPVDGPVSEVTGTVPAGLSPKLYNDDLAPTSRVGRRWNTYNIFTLWANDVHSLGNYAFAIGLFALGLGGWQILTALVLGGVFLFLLLNLSGFMGEKNGGGAPPATVGATPMTGTSHLGR